MVAPTKVNGFKLIWTVLAFGPDSIIISILKSSIAEYKYSSTIGLKRWISSINKTSLSSRFVSNPAKSPGLSKTGPEVILIPTPNSFAKIFANVVLPKPGGPWNNVWSKASFRKLAAWTKTIRFSNTCSCPEKSSKLKGRNAFSISISCGE